jgi:hypothetical protein
MAAALASKSRTADDFRAFYAAARHPVALALCWSFPMAFGFAPGWVEHYLAVLRGVAIRYAEAAS